jgi:SAM-dependent methyltransferase
MSDPPVREQYEKIAFIYDLLADGDDGMIWFKHHIEELLSKIPAHASVLDCACGTGNHAIWLAKQGYRVSASDISPAMIAEARKKSRREGMDIKFFQSSWEELPLKSDQRFDLVVCPGNSLSHLHDLAMLERSFVAFRQILKAGAPFFFDIRNWEKTYEENSLVAQEFRVESSNGIIEVKYRYDIRGWNEKGQMFVDLRKPGEKEYKTYTFDFLPVSFKKYHETFIKAGFEHTERGFFPGKDYYYVVAR